MSLLSAARKRPDPVSLSFLAVTFMTGVAVALQVPTLSLFLAEEVQVRPFLVGLFYTVNAVIGILISQWLGHRSDSGGDRKQLILRCCVAGIVLSLLFAWNRQYWLLVSLGVVLASLTATASPSCLPWRANTPTAATSGRTCSALCCGPSSPWPG